MFDVLRKIFGDSEKKSSAEDARKRLKYILIYDRAAVSPEMMEHLKNDIIKVISKYMDIRPDDMDIRLETDEETNALVVNTPIYGIAHNGKRLR